MKYVLGLGLLIVGGALASGACTQSDSDGNANDRRSSSGGDGGTTASGGNGGDGGTAGGSGGYDTGGSGGSGGSDATGGSAGEGGWNAAGAAGENGTGGSEASGGSGGTGGDFCAGDDELDDLPSCDDLPYAATTCSGEVPIGVSLCEQYAENATDEAFAAAFACLDELTVDCDDLAAHSEGVRDCTVSYFPCETELAVEKCEAFGCDAIEEDLCLAFLSSFTDDGVQSVIDCSNEATETPAGSPWGGSSEVIECDRAFLDCFSLGTAE